MPTAEARALSLQEQQSLELIAAQVSATAEQMYAQGTANGVSEDELSAMYLALITGAVSVVTSQRAAYLRAFARAQGEAAPPVPSNLARAALDGALAPGVRVEGAVTHVAGLQRKWTADMVAKLEQDLAAAREKAAEKLTRAAAEGVQDAVENAVENAVDEFKPMSMAEVQRRAQLMAAGRLSQLAESTVMSASDYATREILARDKKVAALRRVVHPGACERCTRVAGVLVFKQAPRLRHDQCRCSFEPVYVNDPQYQDRLLKYQMNVSATGGAYARNVRYRGRQQLAAADIRENSPSVRAAWERFLQDEEKRANNLVKTIKSNTFRDWDVMTAVTDSSGGAGFPLVTRR